MALTPGQFLERQRALAARTHVHDQSHSRCGASFGSLRQNRQLMRRCLLTFAFSSTTWSRYATATLHKTQLLCNLPASVLRLEDPRRQKLVYLLGIVINVSFQRKVARVHTIQHKILHIMSECISASLDEDDVIRGSESKHWHAARAGVLLPLRIELTS